MKVSIREAGHDADRLYRKGEDGDCEQGEKSSPSSEVSEKREYGWKSYEERGDEGARARAWNVGEAGGEVRGPEKDGGYEK